MKKQGSESGDQRSGMGPGAMVPPLRPVSFSCWSGIFGLSIILMAAAAAVAPQLVHGPSCGHDFDFHLVSWMDALNAWRHGIAYPHWSPSANFGAGEPRFVFYPPLTWMLGAALGAVLPWTLVPAALTFLLLAATGLATRALARQALANGPATLAGCAAIFSGYALFTAYERSAFGELAGGFWIPLLLLLVLRDRNPADSTLRRARDGAAPLALAVAGAWLSNVPVGVMACYLLAAAALTVAVLLRSWAPVIRAFLGASLGLGVASIYLLPAAWEQRWVDIRQATGDPGSMIENSWLFARHADPALASHDTVLFKVSLIGASMIAVALGGLIVSWLRGRLPQDRRRWIPLALIPLAVLFLWLPISLPVWNWLPRLRFLQFPWRWLVALEAPMAIFFAAAVWPREGVRRWQRVAVAAACAALFLTATTAANRYFFQACDDEDSVPGMMGVYGAGAGFAGTDEYAPPGADNSLLAMGLPGACFTGNPAAVLGVLANPATEDAVPAWDAAQGSCEATFAMTPQTTGAEHLRLIATTAHAGYLVLRLRSYPAWRVTVNGQPAARLPRRDDGLIAVPVPQGQVSLSMDWTTTPDMLAGRWLCGLGVLLLTALCLPWRRLTRPRLS